MKLELVRIGNSRGIRIPKPVIDQCGFGDSVQMVVEGGHIVISRVRQTREGWRDLFKGAGRPEEKLVPDVLLPNHFDDSEWQW